MWFESNGHGTIYFSEAESKKAHRRHECMCGRREHFEPRGRGAVKKFGRATTKNDKKEAEIRSEVERKYFSHLGKSIDL